MIRKLACAFVAMTPLLIAGAAGAAQLTFPTTEASACQKVSGPMVRTVTKIKFKGDKTGTIILTCPFDVRSLAEDNVQTVVQMQYRDSTGGNSGASVKARLIKMHRETGATTSLLLFDSEDTFDTGAGLYDFSGVDTPVPETLDFMYNIEIEMKRKKPSQTVEFYGIRFVTL